MSLLGAFWDVSLGTTVWAVNQSISAIDRDKQRFAVWAVVLIVHGVHLARASSAVTRTGLLRRSLPRSVVLSMTTARHRTRFDSVARSSGIRW